MIAEGDTTDPPDLGDVDQPFGRRRRAARTGCNLRKEALDEGAAQRRLSFEAAELAVDADQRRGMADDIDRSGSARRGKPQQPLQRGGDRGPALARAVDLRLPRQRQDDCRRPRRRHVFVVLTTGFHFRDYLSWIPVYVVHSVHGCGCGRLSAVFIYRHGLVLHRGNHECRRLRRSTGLFSVDELRFGDRPRARRGARRTALRPHAPPRTLTATVSADAESTMVMPGATSSWPPSDCAASAASAAATAASGASSSWLISPAMTAAAVALSSSPRSPSVITSSFQPCALASMPPSKSASRVRSSSAKSRSESMSNEIGSSASEPGWSWRTGRFFGSHIVNRNQGNRQRLGYVSWRADLLHL